MYSYIKGVITEIMPGYIVLDNNGIGYKINTPNPYSFKENEEYTISGTGSTAKIILNNTIKPDNRITFIVLKSKIGSSTV